MIACGLATLQEQKIRAHIAGKSDEINMPEAKLAIKSLRENKVLSLQQITDPPRDANIKK